MALRESKPGLSPGTLFDASFDAAPPSSGEGFLQMCGIFGAVFLQNGNFPRGAAVDVDAALLALEHRGPDYAGRWRSEDAAFGHTRLAIVDLSPAGHQPMVAADGSVVVLLNGEIYNFRELRDQLADAGHAFRSRSDTEVVLEGYRAWGVDVIQRLDGMFAIAIWDVREKRLILARDRVGKKPVFYTESTGGEALAFASETEALFAAGVPCEPNLSAFPSLFSGGSVRAPATMYHGIAQLPPAHLLIADRRGVQQLRRYWSPPFHAPRLFIDEEEAAREVRRLVDAAVERRIQADVPVGALLSGGVDSTITAGVMSRAIGSRLHTFAVGFSGDLRFDETSYARLASSRFGTEHHELILEPSSFASLPRLVELHDGPFADASAIPMAAIAKRAKQTVTVALSGDGGDEVFCGYSRFVYAEASERTPRFLRDFGAQVARLSEAGEGSTAVGARAARAVRKAQLPTGDLLLAWCNIFAFDLDRLFRPEVAAAIDTFGPRRSAASLVAANPGATQLAGILAYNFETYLPDDLLLKADRASMLHAVELRSPFLDRAVIEFAARLPDRLLRRGLATKWILKRAYEDLIPTEIVHRSKMGFGVPLVTWLNGPLRSLVEDSFADSSPIWDYVSRDFVRKLLKEQQDGRADHGLRVFLLLTFHIWLMGLQKRRAAPPSLRYVASL